jgi:hypothetical protein
MTAPMAFFCVLLPYRRITSDVSTRDTDVPSRRLVSNPANQSIPRMLPADFSRLSDLFPGPLQTQSRKGITTIERRRSRCGIQPHLASHP